MIMEELIRNFGIDWKLLLAQAVNFFILLFLLKKFAYQPLFDLMRRRREEIESGLRFAEKAKEELAAIAQTREKELQKARSEALNVVTQAEELGKSKRDELVREAHKKVEGVVSGARRLIEEEKAKMGEVVAKDARVLIQRGLEKVIGVMPSEEKNTSLIDSALRELRTVSRK